MATSAIVDSKMMSRGLYWKSPMIPLNVNPPDGWAGLADHYTGQRPYVLPTSYELRSSLPTFSDFLGWT